MLLCKNTNDFPCSKRRRQTSEAIFANHFSYRKYRFKENLAFFEDSKTQTPINQAKMVKGKRIFPLFLHQHPPTALGCALENLSFSQAEYGRWDAFVWEQTFCVGFLWEPALRNCSHTYFYEWTEALRFCPWVRCAVLAPCIIPGSARYYARR